MWVWLNDPFFHYPTFPTWQWWTKWTKWRVFAKSMSFVILPLTLIDLKVGLQRFGAPLGPRVVSIWSHLQLCAGTFRESKKKNMRPASLSFSLSVFLRSVSFGSFPLDPFNSEVLRFVKICPPGFCVFFFVPQKTSFAWFIQGASPSPCWKRPTPLAISWHHWPSRKAQDPRPWEPQHRPLGMGDDETHLLGCLRWRWPDNVHKCAYLYTQYS